MVSILVFLFILGLLIIVHEFGHFIIAKKLGVKVENFSFGFGKNLFKKRKGDTDYCINAIPFGGFVKLAGDNREEFKGAPDEYLSRPASQRAAIIFFGPLLNYVMGFLCFWLIFFIGYPTLTTKIGGLKEGYGAKSAGLQIGDKVTAIDGEQVKYFEEIQKIIFDKKDTSSVKVTVLRNDKEMDFNVGIKQEQVKDIIGQEQKIGFMGIEPADEIIEIRHGFFKSFSLSAIKTWDLTVLTYKALWRMITGKLSFRDSVTGPLGIFYITSKAAKVGFIAVLHLIAVLSISLGIFNLLPLPVLDGGHILFLGLEKIRRKPLSAKAERIVTQFGFTLIMALAIIVTLNDIIKFKDKLFFFLK